MREILHAASRARRRDLLNALVRQIGWTVQSGPFAGMTLSGHVAWGDGDLLPKLLGCYESELHPALLELAGGPHDLVVNIGAAEGYYAIGMARILPAAFVHAFDSDPKAQEVCRAAALVNGVAARISVSGKCSIPLLEAILPRGRSPVVLCDCEGAEKELIDPRRIGAMRNATLLIECHDFLDAAITPALVERLEPTHTLIGIREGARDPGAFALLNGWDSLDRWLAVCEYRPCAMHWLMARPKSSGRSNTNGLTC